MGEAQNERGKRVDQRARMPGITVAPVQDDLVALPESWAIVGNTASSGSFIGAAMCGASLCHLDHRCSTRTFLSSRNGSPRLRTSPRSPFSTAATRVRSAQGPSATDSAATHEELAIQGRSTTDQQHGVHIKYRPRLGVWRANPGRCFRLNHRKPLARYGAMSDGIRERLAPTPRELVSRRNWDSVTLSSKAIWGSFFHVARHRGEVIKR